MVCFVLYDVGFCSLLLSIFLYILYPFLSSFSYCIKHFLSFLAPRVLTFMSFRVIFILYCLLLFLLLIFSVVAVLTAVSSCSSLHFICSIILNITFTFFCLYYFWFFLVNFHSLSVNFFYCFFCKILY